MRRGVGGHSRRGARRQFVPTDGGSVRRRFRREARGSGSHRLRLATRVYPDGRSTRLGGVGELWDELAGPSLRFPRPGPTRRSPGAPSLPVPPHVGGSLRPVDEPPLPGSLSPLFGVLVGHLAVGVGTSHRYLSAGFVTRFQGTTIPLERARRTVPPPRSRPARGADRTARGIPQNERSTAGCKGAGNGTGCHPPRSRTDQWSVQKATTSFPSTLGRNQKTGRPGRLRRSTRRGDASVSLPFEGRRGSAG
jgi:hypothetical protein